MARGVKHKAILAEHPFCIYCGGEEPATSIDHMPNKGMFPKDRQSGLEFPCCYSCNQSSKWFEDIVSFVGSVQFDNSEATDDHFETKLKHLSKTQPEVLSEFWPTRRMEQSAGAYLFMDTDESCGALNLSGKRTAQAILLYGAKLGMALHWEKTGQILQKHQKVEVSAFSNIQALENEIPTEILELLPTPSTLRQGRKSSHHSFWYSSERGVDAEISAHFASFGDAIAFQLIVAEPRLLPNRFSKHAFSPGCFQTNMPAQIDDKFICSIGPIQIQ